MRIAYSINRHLVCINPTVEAVYESNKFHVPIEYASDGNVWNYGYRIEYKGVMTGCGFSSSAPSFSEYDHNFPDKETCRAAALRYVKEDIIEEGDHPCGASHKPILERIEQMLSTQLTLF